MRWLHALLDDTRYAWRSLVRDRGVAAIVVLTLALGVGVNAATFAVLDRMYLRPPPGVADPDGLRRLWVRHFNTEDGVPFASPGLNWAQYQAIRAQAPDSTRLALFAADFALREGTALEAPRLRGVFATASYWRVLGVRPALGRLYTDDEDRIGAGADVVVVSHDFWQHRLGGDRAALGRRLAVESKTYTVIGVLPRDFAGTHLRPADVWIPLAARPPIPWAQGNWWELDYINNHEALQRVDGDEVPGAVVAFEARAARALRRVNTDAAPKRPDSLSQVIVGPIVGPGPQVPGQEMRIATRLGGVALVVLVIACANVVNLLLARAVRRRREIAVRLALGVTRGRLVRLLATEGVLLAALAAGAALLAGWWWGEVLRAMLLEGVEWRERALDGRVVAFTVALALVATLASSLVPAFRSSTPRLTEALKQGVREGGGRHARLRSALVMVQAALSVALLVGAALFTRSLHNVRGLDIGYDAGRLLFGEVEFERGRAPDAAAREAAMAGVAERLRGHPAVEEVARSGMQPMQGISFLDLFLDQDSITGPMTPVVSGVSPEFFRAAGIRFERGRPFASATAFEIVVNDAFARRYWPGREALGQCIRLHERTSPCHVVTGVVETVRRGSVIEKEPAPQYYLALGDPLLGREWVGATIVVRARGAAESAAATRALRGALKDAFPAALPSVTPMTANLEPEYRPWKLGARLFTGFGLLALAVAMVGMYGTVSYGVSQRAREFGVRAALGARARDLVTLVLGESLRTAVAGVLLGVLLSLAAGRLVSSLVFGISPRDPVVLVGVAAVLLVVAALAALLPAWRGARVDPVAVLRAE